jgi:hypothetical protein
LGTSRFPIRIRLVRVSAFAWLFVRAVRERPSISLEGGALSGPSAIAAAVSALAAGAKMASEQTCPLTRRVLIWKDRAIERAPGPVRFGAQSNLRGRVSGARAKKSLAKQVQRWKRVAPVSGARLAQRGPPIGWRAFAMQGTARASGRLRDRHLRDCRLFDLRVDYTLRCNHVLNDRL